MILTQSAKPTHDIATTIALSWFRFALANNSAGQEWARTEFLGGTGGAFTGTLGTANTVLLFRALAFIMEL